MDARDFISFSFQVGHLLGTMSRVKMQCEQDHVKLAECLRRHSIDYIDFMNLCEALRNVSNAFYKERVGQEG